MNYWSKCIKCPRMVVSREAVVCNHCETGKITPVAPPYARSFPNILRLLGNSTHGDTAICEYKGRTITYGEIKNVTTMDHITTLELKNGEFLSFTNGGYINYEYEEV